MLHANLFFWFFLLVFLRRLSHLQDVKLSDLTTVAKLGSGAFGMVTLVKHKGSYYALKQMHKSQIVQMELQVTCLFPSTQGFSPGLQWEPLNLRQPDLTMLHSEDEKKCHTIYKNVPSSRIAFFRGHSNYEACVIDS